MIPEENVMKAKLLILLATSSMTLVGCNKAQPELSIMTPTGAPALAFYNHVTDAKFETNSVPNNILTEMVGASKDVVVLPTNVGVKAIVSQNVQYKIAATITFGNFHVAATGHDDDGVMGADDYIVLFQKNNVPDKLFHAVYGNSLDAGLHYVDDVSWAAKCLIQGKDVTTETKDPVDYVLIAEPAFTSAKAQKATITEYANIQEKYKEVQTADIFQASVFIKNGVDATSFLENLKGEVEAVIANGDLIVEKTSSLSAEDAQTRLGVAPQVAANVTKNGNGMGLGFKYARENKEGIDKFLSLFGMNATSEEIYY